MKFLRDTAILFGLSMKRILRSPDTIITVTIMLVAIMLMFVYVFGGAAGAEIWIALVWCAGITLAAYCLAMRAYKQKRRNYRE
jgi:steroid 5-alpha reductase family enzyme